MNPEVLLKNVHVEGLRPILHVIIVCGVILISVYMISGDKTIEFKDQFSILFNYPDVIDEKRKFIGMMKDLLYDYPKQMNLMITLYQMDIHKELRNIADINDIFIHRYVKRLENEMGISKENAIWATKMWCDVYGKKLLIK